MIGYFYTKPLQGEKFRKLFRRNSRMLSHLGIKRDSNENPAESDENTSFDMVVY